MPKAQLVLVKWIMPKAQLVLMMKLNDCLQIKDVSGEIVTVPVANKDIGCVGYAPIYQ